MSNNLTFYKSDPSRLPYYLDLAGGTNPWLVDGDTIASYILTPAGVTTDGDSDDGSIITIWVEGATGAIEIAVVSTNGLEEVFTMTFVEAC